MTASHVHCRARRSSSCSHTGGSSRTGPWPASRCTAAWRRPFVRTMCAGSTRTWAMRISGGDGAPSRLQAAALATAWLPHSCCINVHVYSSMVRLHVVGTYRDSRLAWQGSQATTWVPSGLRAEMCLACAAQTGLSAWQTQVAGASGQHNPAADLVGSGALLDLSGAAAGVANTERCVRVECSGLSHGVSVVPLTRNIRVLSFTQDTTVNMSSFRPALETAFARAGIPRRSDTPRQ